MAKVKHQSEVKITKDICYLALTGDPWGSIVNIRASIDRTIVLSLCILNPILMSINFIILQMVQIVWIQMKQKVKKTSSRTSMFGQNREGFSLLIFQVS